MRGGEWRVDERAVATRGGSKTCGMRVGFVSKRSDVCNEARTPHQPDMRAPVGALMSSCVPRISRVDRARMRWVSAMLNDNE